MEEEKSGKRMKRKATIGRRWPSGLVPYEIEPGTFCKLYGRVVALLIKININSSFSFSYTYGHCICLSI